NKILHTRHWDGISEKEKSNRIPAKTPSVEAAIPVVMPPTRGLVALYQLNGNALDNSGLGNHGTEYGGVHFLREGTTGVGARFDGRTGHIIVPDSTSLHLERFTLAAYVKPILNEGGNRIVEKGNSNSYWLDINPEGKALVGFFDGYYRDIRSGNPLRTHTLNFLLGTFDGITLRLNVNGMWIEQLSLGRPSKPLPNKQPLVIGWKHNGIPADHFAGNLYEVRLFNRALLDSEVQICGASLRSDFL